MCKLTKVWKNEPHSRQLQTKSHHTYLRSSCQLGPRKMALGQNGKPPLARFIKSKLTNFGGHVWGVPLNWQLLCFRLSIWHCNFQLLAINLVFGFNMCLKKIRFCCLLLGTVCPAVIIMWHQIGQITRVTCSSRSKQYTNPLIRIPYGRNLS